MGYKIQTWNEKDGEQDLRETPAKGEQNRTFVNKFTPFAKNFARLLVYNGRYVSVLEKIKYRNYFKNPKNLFRYNGPTSETLSFDMPEGVPGPVSNVEATPMGSSAFYLTWKEPEQPNGRLTGYKIYYQTVIQTGVGSLIEREPHISDPRQTKAKLAGLEPDTKYRIHLRGISTYSNLR